jgi:hypothetical protein
MIRTTLEHKEPLLLLTENWIEHSLENTIAVATLVKTW